MIALMLKEFGKIVAQLGLCLRPILVAVRDPAPPISSQSYKQVGETHAVVPKLYLFRTYRLELRVDIHYRLVDLHVYDAFENTDLRRRDCPARAEAPSKVEERITHVRDVSMHVVKLMLMDRSTGSMQIRISEQEYLANGHPTG